MHNISHFIEQVIVEEHIQAEIVKHGDWNPKNEAKNNDQDGDDVDHKNGQESAHFEPYRIFSPQVCII